MKKIIALCIFFCLFVAAPVFSSQKTLGLVISTLNNPFFVTLKEGAQTVADKAGVKLVVFDSQDDSAKMTSAIEDLIQKKVDAILVNPTDSDAVVPSVLKANKAGIPIFTIDRGSSGGKVVSHIASDNVAGGRMAGDFIVKKLNGTGKIVELMGIPGTSAARDRGKGFNEVVSSQKELHVVAAQTADFNRDKGLKVFENILQSNPDIDAVFAHNDEMILGAIAASEATGKSGILFVGFDAIDDAVDAVNKGVLAATVAQQPFEIGSIGVEKAVEYLDGKEQPKFVPVSLMLVTK